MSKIKPKIDISKLEIKTIYPKLQTIKSIVDFDQSKETKANFNIALNPLFSLEGNAIKIELAIAIDLEYDGKNHSKIGEFAFDFIYQYNSLSELLDEEEMLNPDIFLTCSNISYSTLRGIIFNKSENTCLENVLLPIVTGAELMKGLVEPS